MENDREIILEVFCVFFENTGSQVRRIHKWNLVHRAYIAYESLMENWAKK